MCVKRRCRDSSEMRSSTGVDTRSSALLADDGDMRLTLSVLKAQQVGHMKGL